MTIVLDTCALLWYTIDPSELSLSAHKNISSSEEVLVSAISVWEVGIKTVRGRLNIGMSFQEYVELISKASDFQIVPVDHLLWAESVLLDWEHRDPADRVIVALAKRNQAKIISDDSEIKKFYKQTIA